ncbi:hypothetical protein Q5P01_015497 [Channa striata]|uniref:alanine transaminase n=1 Tax=Channa striata TaxID=64152 RepID=A0AA88MC97_CHASR|nr:hypothetical protein Q5P01_015497 [Channa striata]
MIGVRDVNPRVRAIRTPTSLQSQAAGITKQIAQGVRKPFAAVMDVSSGDPHRAGMAPISFVRQVLAACLHPELLKETSFPPDVRQRARSLLGACNGGSVGSYCVTSYGLPHVLRRVAEFIQRRDGGVISHSEDIIFSSGSQAALMLVLHLMASGEGVTQTGVLTPTPCPHTLPMLMDEAGVRPVPYQLSEERGWTVDAAQLHRALKTARRRCAPRAIYISNPGNPTGHVLDRTTIEEVIRFAATEGLVLLAEEVQQDSVFGQDRQFVSFKKVLFEMGSEYSETVELISFHSISAAFTGECGLRGGYMEVINMEPAVKQHLKSMQGSGSPALLPQLALELSVNPPAPGDGSYDTYAQEISHIRTTLSQNAQRACEFLNGLPGVSCQLPMAGVFLYPRVHVPQGLVEEAKTRGVEADVLYCQKFLEEQGVCLGPGCENGQDDQKHHIRLCVLAPTAALDDVLARLQAFHLRLRDTFP